MNDKEKQQIVAEVNILRDLQHPNIVRYYDRCIDKRNLKLYIIMEYCEKGDLQQVIKRCLRNKEHIKEETIWRILAQVVSGLHFCHRRTQSSQINRGEATTAIQPQEHPQAKARGGQQRILHRDLKPGNIFIDASSTAKLGDFGLARVLNQGSVYAQTNVGTPYYMSPEQINEQKYNEKSDIWSLGCLTYEMAALRPPFKAQNQLALALKIKEGQYERIPERYSKELWTLIQSMLRLDQEERHSVDQLVRHPLIEPHLEPSFKQRLQSEVTDQKAAPSSKESLQMQLLQDKLRKKEAALKEREAYLKEKEQFLSQKENELLQRERALNTRCEEKTQELNENERLLNEILKRYELPTVTGDLRQALQTAVERTSQGSTCGCGSARGSISHNLKDSKQFCSDSFSPLKSGGCLSIKEHQMLGMSKEFYCCGASSEDKASSQQLRNSQAILQSLNSKNQSKPKECCAHQMALQSSGSPRLNLAAHHHGVRGQQLLKNNKSDPNMRTLAERPSSQHQQCQTSVKKRPSNAAVESSLLSNFVHYATQASATVGKAKEQCEAALITQSLPKQNGVGDAGSPMEILKRFKMQKRVSQQQQKQLTLTTVEDDTVNEQDLPCEDELPPNSDNTFRDTVFNPKSTNPIKILTHRSSAAKLQLKRQPSLPSQNQSNQKRLETQTSMGTMSQYQTAQQQSERPFNRTFDSGKLTQAIFGAASKGKHGPSEQPKRASQRTSSMQGASSSLQALLQAVMPSSPQNGSALDPCKTYDARDQKRSLIESPQGRAQTSALAMQRQRSVPSDCNSSKVGNRTAKSGQSLQALLRLSTANGMTQLPQHPQTARAINTAREKNLPPKTGGLLLSQAANAPQKSIKLQRPAKPLTLYKKAL